jgi:hypothetical protein
MPLLHFLNEGLRLPSVDDCPGCSAPRDSRHTLKRPRYDDRDRRPISKCRHKGRCVSVHDRLGGRIQDRRENKSNDRIPDDGTLDHEVEHRHSFRYNPEAYPQWCPGGLTRSQKRKVQRLHHREQEEHAQEEKQVKSQAWHIKRKTDEMAPSASVNMVHILPMEFKASADGV